ncbi:MAG: aminomethyl-transferring glycine dehydrogenase subunit GcvPB [Thermotoga sp.]|nr:MAG: aminomethyl-transferring glycine dehydrogenase subunit GcvPB [Thermotoga sp.]HDM70104.1 glycine dehydrogenase subunit 2 [Thermotogales bacterium]
MGRVRTVFEKSVDGRRGSSVPSSGFPKRDLDEMIPKKFIRSTPLNLPKLSEPEVVRHYTNLSRMNYSIDVGFYPLGSCTMKYNPKMNEIISRFEGFTFIHPYQPEESVQGALRIMYELQEKLKKITGMDHFTLQPSAGAHGEFTGMLIIKKYHEDRGDFKRKKVLIPDSAHGTNPASSAMCGFEVVELKSGKDGRVDLAELKSKLNDEVAALMLTNPNTLGLYEKEIEKIADLVHDAGALLYYDGANLNAILGRIKPGDMGFDVVHLNLHKTFSTPHGMGGPGAGPVGVKEKLRDFLPVPIVDFKNGRFYLNYDLPKSIGRVRSFHGNFIVMVKALAYVDFMGEEGLKKVAELSVLNANYMRKKISEFLKIPYNDFCMHEFVASGEELKKYGVKTIDLAKRLMDYGFHPPTIYFPLIVHEAIMIEPTETETKETLDNFIEALKKIVEEAKSDPNLLKNAPTKTPVGRLDEVRAVRKPKLRWRGDDK